MADTYWEDTIMEAASDCGVVLTKEQINCFASWASSAHENYRQAMGHDVADRNWRAQEDENLIKKGANKVLGYVEDRLSSIDNGPSRVFDAMNREQRLAMHELFQARSFLRKSGVPVT